MRVIDLRLFKLTGASGMKNACFGLLGSGFFSGFLASNAFKKKYCHELDDYIFNPKQKKNNGRTVVILPFPRMDIRHLTVLVNPKKTLGCFVHDLHIFSRHSLMREEFPFNLKYFIRKFVFWLTIKICKEIYVDSVYVQRQLRIIFRKDSKVVRLKRPKSTFVGFSTTKTHDVFLPLEHRKYKCSWILDNLRFSGRVTVLAPKGLEKEGDYLKSLNSNISVDYVETRSNQEFYGAIAKCRFILITSRFEGFGFLPMEAVQLGTVPIVLNRTAFKELPNWSCIKVYKRDLNKLTLDDIEFDMSVAQDYWQRHLIE